jgi:hypothetical protein
MLNLGPSRTSDTTETRNPCVIKVSLLACSTYIDIFKFYLIVERGKSVRVAHTYMTFQAWWRKFG